MTIDSTDPRNAGLTKTNQANVKLQLTFISNSSSTLSYLSNNEMHGSDTETEPSDTLDDDRLLAEGIDASLRSAYEDNRARLNQQFIEKTEQRAALRR